MAVLEPNISEPDEPYEEPRSPEDTDEEDLSTRELIAGVKRQAQRMKDEDRLRKRACPQLYAEQASEYGASQLRRAEDDRQRRLIELRAEMDRNEAIQTRFLQCGCNAEAFGWVMLDTACQDITYIKEEIDALEAHC